ncbi:MAG: hypothetical protein ACPG7F_13285 [Aggregatilineales bacterium]
MKTFFRTGILFLLLILTATTFAQDRRLIEVPGGGINDPRANSEANACFIGGALAGLCSDVDLNGNGVIESSDRLAMWRYGWFLIRYNKGTMTSGQFLEGVTGLVSNDVINQTAPGVIPPPTPVSVSRPGAGCRAVSAEYYVNFGTQTLLALRSPVYLDANCTVGAPALVTLPLVFGVSKSAADEICRDAGYINATATIIGDGLRVCN